MPKHLWKSEAIRLSTHTCVDVAADRERVVLGQVGDFWMHDLHLTAAQALQVAEALMQGATRTEASAN